MAPSHPHLSPLDRLLAEVDHALRTSFAPAACPNAPNPADKLENQPLTYAERILSEGLMRINHTGEIAAQALYRGQATVASDPAQRQHLLKAADEEQDHLVWCQQRLDELQAKPSMLAPVWYAGSFLIGVAAGLAGDRWSLGFIEETETQVSAHLDDHLQRLPTGDRRSHAIVQQMREDEARHADAARAAGAQTLPDTVKTAMAQTANVMRFLSFRW